MNRLIGANSPPASRKHLKNVPPVFLPWKMWWTRLCTSWKPAGAKFLHRGLAQKFDEQTSWSRLKKNFRISARTQDNFSNSIAIGFMRRSRGQLMKPVIPGGGSPIT